MQTAAAQKTAPSRKFQVQQAVLTALHAIYPLSIQEIGRARAARRLEALIHDEFEEGAEFCALVRRQFAERF